MITRWAWLRLIGLFALSLAVVGCSTDATRNGAALGKGDWPAPQLTSGTAPLKVLVLGGTSGIGLEVVKQSVARGHQVTAVARHPERMKFSHASLTTTKGDVMDAEAMARIVPGQDIVINAIGVGPTRERVTVFSQGMKNILAVMPATGRLLAVTGIGAGNSRGHGSFFYDNILWPLLLKTVYQDKDIQEALIRDSALDWTIVRPGFLVDDPAEKRYYVIKSMQDFRSGDISRADVGHFLVACFEQQLYQQETVFLSN
ncbi:MAG: putative NADH-flavin reductase [Paraglaciecola psychrophila]